MSFNKILEKLLNKKDLSFEESFEIASAIIKGELSEAQTSAILVALRAKGESSHEIAGFALAMRDSSVKVGPWYDAVDTAGTGGDGFSTFNASTASAIIISNSTKVAKHGNKGVSSMSGSAEFLEALGYNILVRPDEAENLIQDFHFVFLFAQFYHPSLKNVAQIRKALGIRTIFNILGPLTNPAGVKKQVIGVYSRDLLQPVSEALLTLDAQNVYLVHGFPGIDEVSVSGFTEVVRIKRKSYEQFRISLEDLKLKEPINIEKLKIKGPEDSAARFIRALKGKDPALKMFIVANSALGLLASGIVSELSDGIELAERLVEKGNETLRRVVASHGNLHRLEILERMSVV